MPIREYRCRKCEHRFENIEVDLRDGKVFCPNCRSKNVERLPSLFSNPNSGKRSCDVTRRFG